MSKKKRTFEDVNLYELYLNDIRKYGTFDDVTTREYLKLYRTGTPKERKLAKERIVGAHQRFVLSIANKYIHNDNLMDIISEGNIGLMKAIDGYDINSEVKFTTYATYWIRKRIMDYITVEEPIVTPNNAIRIATYVPKIRQEFWNKHLRQPTNTEIQSIMLEKYNLNFSNEEDLSVRRSVSIDEKYDEDEDGQEFMESSAYTSRTATCNTNAFEKDYDNKAVVKSILSTLNERDAYIIKCLYGIDCEAKTMSDIASEVGVSDERVRQIVVNSVQKLKDNRQSLIGAF